MAAQTATGPNCQLYAVVDVGPSAAERIGAVLAAFPLTSLLLVPRAGQSLTAATVLPLVELSQRKNCAVLLADNAALARTVRADGVHLSAGVDLDARYDEARSILGSGAIVGADAGTSRHLAMQLGEAGADYVGFSQSATDAQATAGAPVGDDEAEDVDVGPQQQDELIAWWSRVFEVPCVALGVTAAEDARQFSALGADFVAVELTAGESVSASVERFLAFARAVEDAHVD